ncbi:MAG: bifunctional demethylmenaquinone methyltransferase/2-methoxy-6-polyprenyl-1,4-benzoquinol methylase UbiE [Alistipes sp.]|nr:bifunctional demethylmenaquinone methyltransferase/2-methoxy-6-polyprenyl-1,4-benzoquinol methylase UbiE [Alistipes sp.]
MKPYNSDKSKKEEVREMFNNIAPTYDRLNHILSLSIDKMWRRRVVRLVRRLKPARVMDLATGTGDLAIKMAKRIPEARIMGVDLSENMLAVAAEKVRRQGLEDHIALYQGDAEQLDVNDGLLDVVTVAFGVRNFGNLEQGLREIWRALHSGGHIVILEFSTPSNPIVRKLYEFYSNHVMKPVGGMLSKDQKAYDYLPDSIVEFPAPDKFIALLQKVGFAECRRRSQSCGIAQIYIARKP